MRRAVLRLAWVLGLLAPSFGLAMPTVAGSPRPSPRQRRAVVRAYGVQLLPGRLILGRPTDAYIANAGRPPRPRGVFDVVAHGNQTSIGIQRADGSWIDYDAAKLAAEIRQSGGWNGKSPIRLLSCHVGVGSHDFAEQLARLLGVPVYAPDDYISLTRGAADFGRGHAPTQAMKLSDFRLIRPDGSS